jgi:hypothetical protein
MKNLKKNKDSIEVSLNKDFYSKKAMLIASEAFSETCFTSLDLNDKDFIVTLKPKEEFDLETLGLEFCNFVLGIMQNE